MIIEETSMSSKYQITIPAEVRAGMGIDSANYDIVWMKIPSGEFAIIPKKKLGKDENPMMRMSGMFAKYGNGHEVDDFIKEKRAEALRENL